jgi:hypothetical protein
LIKIQAATAAEICARFQLPSDGRKVLAEGMAPGAFVEALLTNKQFVTAIDFMAHALPLREGVWWGCLCMQHVFGNDLPEPARAAGKAVVQWVLQPSEENRTAAKDPGEAAGPVTPAGALAMAIGQNGPVSSKAVANAVKIASLKTEPVQVANMQKAFVDLALELAEGRYL